MSIRQRSLLGSHGVKQVKGDCVLCLVVVVIFLESTTGKYWCELTESGESGGTFIY